MRQLGRHGQRRNVTVASSVLILLDIAAPRRLHPDAPPHDSSAGQWLQVRLGFSRLSWFASEPVLLQTTRGGLQTTRGRGRSFGAFVFGGSAAIIGTR